MLVSYEILKKYVELPKGVTPEQVAYDLTMATVEVESIKKLGNDLKNIVVGKVKKISKHPNADKLSLAMVDVGSQEIEVVCGGINLAKGQLVAFAKVGAMVRWHGKGDLVKLEKAKIRGVESSGMICSANEIGLFEMFPHKEMEILDLSDLKLRVGEPLAKALGIEGIVFDIDNKSLTNRPDLWGHYGIARELSAIYGVNLKEIELYGDSKIQNINNKKDINSKSQNNLSVEIKDYDLCPRYLGCVVENIKVEESPEWLKKELMALGHSVINNIVDITNYVMEETGQPLHSFDLAKLNQTSKTSSPRLQIPKIIIRRAKNGEKLALLDGSEPELDEETLVIADARKPIALAGIMGGRDSGISESTKTIILEAANFNAANNRRSSQRLNIRTDSSMRFEKALDVQLAEIGMRRALALIKEILPEAKINPIIVKDGKGKDKDINIEVSHSFLENRIGISLKKEEVIGILGRLGFKVQIEGAAGHERKEAPIKGQGILYNIKVPSWRASGDVSIPEDIVEEVARIYGYDNLGEKVELVSMNVAKYQKKYDLENKAKNYLSLGAGMCEVFNYPWTSEGEIEIINPPLEEQKFLQTSLMPNITKNVIDNIRFSDSFKIFELARVYKKEMNKWNSKMGDSLPYQPKMLAGAVVDKKGTFFEAKGIVEGLGLEFKDLDIYSGKDKLGYIKELENSKFKNKRVTVFEIDFEKYLSLKKTGIKYQKISDYPGIARDIAVALNWKIKWLDVKNALEKIDKLVYSIKFLSDYPLGDKKSLAFRVEYRADRTLTDSEVEKVEQKIIRLLKSEFKGELRQ